jgi:hypothetical protein
MPSHQASFRSTWSLTFYRQTPRRLGPRSLVPPPFLERCVRAYSRPGCCLPTSATAYDVRTNRSGALVFLAGTMAMTTFLFLRLTHDLLELPREAVGRGEPRIRPCDLDPGAGSSWLPRFARPRYLDHRDTSHDLALSRQIAGVQCRLTCTGLWTERRTCPRSWRRFLGV